MPPPEARLLAHLPEERARDAEALAAALGAGARVEVIPGADEQFRAACRRSGGP